MRPVCRRWYWFAGVLVAVAQAADLSQEREKMKQLHTMVLFLGLAVLALSLTAKPAAAKPAAAGSPVARLAGKWAGDVDALKKQNPEIEQNPMAKMIFAMLAGMKVEFTADTMIAEVMGKSKRVKFKVLSSTPNGLVIEAREGKKKGKRTQITFVDDNHISLLEQGKSGPAMVLRRL